jgi:hypothetical protein
MEYLRGLTVYLLIGAFSGALGGAFISLGDPLVTGLLSCSMAVVGSIFYVLEPYGDVAMGAFAGAVLFGPMGGFFLPIMLGWSLLAGAAAGASGGAGVVALMEWAFGSDR